MMLIDKYLIKQFLLTILFALFTFLAIFIIVDLMEHIDEFIDNDISLPIVLKYYAVFLPQMIRYMTPISVLLAALFVTGKLSDMNEVTALKASGMSLYRYMAPFIITAIFISLISIYFGGYVTPIANKIKVGIERDYWNFGAIRSGNNIFFQDSKTRIVTISSYNVNSEQANIVSIQDFSPNTITQMLSRIDAKKMKFDSSSASWTLYNVVQRDFTEFSETSTKYDEIEMDDLHFSPQDVIKKQIKNEEMTLSELDELAKEQLFAGTNPKRVQIEYHSRIAFAFASIITILFGLPLSTNKRKGGLALQFGINLLITFTYLVFMSISQAFGKNGVMSPILTGWFANIVFFCAALLNIARAPK
jgi:lipopolysaccharide export system permease protein